MSVTHIAGSSINFRGRLLQRCAVCGEKLLDAVPTPFCNHNFFAMGMLITVDGVRVEQRGIIHNDVDVPEDFCIALVES